MSMSNFSSDQVLEFIKQYSKTPKGQQEIRQKMKRKRDFIPKYADKSAGLHTFKQVKRAGEDMADILYKHIIQDTITTGVAADGTIYQRVGLSEFRREDIIVHYPYREGDSFAINISFDKEALHRDSLYKEKYDGIDDIVKLFVHGYSNARGSVYGDWHGVEVHTKRDRPGNGSFLVNAVNEFNDKYKGKAFASLKSEYISESKNKIGGD